MIYIIQSSYLLIRGVVFNVSPKIVFSFHNYYFSSYFLV